MMADETCALLIAEARAAKAHAYAPYSHFTVGAAVLGDDGVIYRGCNVENSSYGLSCCAERNAIFHAVSCGCHDFRAIAIVGDAPDVTMPCGACRQVMAEFHIPCVILARPDDTYVQMTLDELLPNSFSL